MVVEGQPSQNGTNYVEVLNWNFVLPFPPESLNISIPYAIDLSATLGGIHAQHNGHVFTNISLSGTTGILPLKGSGNSKSFGAINSIFGGTIDQAQRVLQSANNLVSNFSGAQTQNTVPASTFLDQLSNINRTSGYYQTRLLEQFLNNYVTLKRGKNGKKYFLAFAVFKDQRIYLCEPVSAEFPRSASGVYEYPYSIQLKAYRTINLGVQVNPGNEYRPAILDSNVVGQMLATIQDARDVVYNGQNVIRSVAEDVDNAFFEPLRKIAIFMKEVANSNLVFADFPQSILESVKSAVVSYVGLYNSSDDLINQYNSAYAVPNKDTLQLVEEIKELVKTTNQSDVGNGFPPPNRGVTVTENTYQYGSQSVSGALASRVNLAFKRPGQFYDFFNRIPIAGPDLPPRAVADINDEVAQVMTFRRADFEEIKLQLSTFRARFEASVGAGDPTFESTFPATKVTAERTPTDDDYQIMYAMNRVIDVANQLASTDWTDRNQTTGIEYVAGLAQRSGIAFQVPVSKFLVPMPYGYSLEDLSRRYLGTPDRWMEIAQLNGLREPFIDEVGFQLPLLVDGNKNQIIVPETDQIYIGQPVVVISNLVPKTKRNVTNIQKVGGTCVLTLSGEQDLNVYKYLAGAYLTAYKPGTVNSQQMIYIPSDVDVDDSLFQTKDIPGIHDFDNIVVGGGTDLLLDQKLDLVITPNGGIPWSVGITNIVQSTLIRLSTVQGTLNHHPLFGLPVKIGQSLADINATQLSAAIEGLFADDPTYAAISNVSVLVSAPSARVFFDLKTPGLSNTIPVSFDFGSALGS